MCQKYSCIEASMEKTELNSHMGFKSVSNIGLEKKKKRLISSLSFG